MSAISARRLLALGFAAFGLRAACAVLTEYKPLFPAYYYTDVNLIHAAAVRALDDLAAGRPPRIGGTLGERIQTIQTLQTYRAFGPRPLAVKLVSSLLGALAVAALAWALSHALPAEAALAAGVLAAVWPSHVFYTSQNLKESPTGLLAYLAFGAALAAASGRGKVRPAASAAAAACFLLGAGFYRSYVLLSLSVGLLAALGLAALGRPPRARALAAAAAVCLALALYPWTSRRLLLAFEPGASSRANREQAPSSVIPITHDDPDPGTINHPTSPDGITAFRRSRQSADRRWARGVVGREIGTQIFPDAEFKTWLDVLAYLPKGAFTVLFMPLPGLYPLDGKLGRLLAALENLALLALAALGAAGAARGPKTPARAAPLLFFCAMTAGAALLEFDLGSSGRHKLLYLPMLFPFAAEEILRRLGRLKAGEKA